MATSKKLKKQKKQKEKEKLDPEAHQEFTPPDGGWGWVVCFASMWVNGTVFGIMNTFGILYVTMRDQYAEGDPDISFKTSWVGSVSTGLTFLMSMVASILSDRFGIRKTGFIGGMLGFIGLVSSAFVQRLELLYLTFGILLGIGSSLIYSPSLIVLGHYFKKHMGLVNGLVSFGSGLFTIIFSLTMPKLLKNIGLQNTFLFLCGIYFVAWMLTFTWRPIMPTANHLPLALSIESIQERRRDCTRWMSKFLNVKIWRNKGYVVWCLSSAVCLFGYFVPFVHLVQYTNDNFPLADGSLLVMCLSITSGVARIIFGKVADIKSVNRIHMQQMAFAVLGMTTMCIPFASNFASLIVICLVMGICDGIFVCLIGPIAFDLVGPRGASQAIGFILAIFSVPMMIGPPIAGFLYDYLGSYTIAFHAAGTPPIIGACLMFFIPQPKQLLPARTRAEGFAAISNVDINSPGEPFRVDHFKSGPATTELLVLSPDDFRDDYRESEGNMEVGDRMSPEHEPMVRSKQRNGDNRGGTTA